jgi:hypothetical protein
MVNINIVEADSAVADSQLAGTGIADFNVLPA